MKLDRNINPDGTGKYALILQRKTPFVSRPFSPGMVLMREESIDFGNTPETEFFVIRLKDIYAPAALIAYAEAARRDDPEYADEIAELARRSMEYPNKRKPD